MKVWIVRYIFSEGGKIPQREGWKTTSGDYVDIGGYYPLMKKGTHAFEHLDGALAAAEAMRAKKLASLRRQISKLEAMEFKPVPLEAAKGQS